MRKGFTLIELSIVLVIVGLLIGGILAGKSMQQTARVTRFVKQIQQYDTAADNFKTQYNQLPGDTTLISPVGNNNGQIRSATDGDGDFTGEMSNYWYHLYLSGMLKSPFTATVSSNIKLDDGRNASPNIPKAEIGTDVGMMVGTPNDDGGAPDAISPVDINIYYVAHYINGAAFDNTNGIPAPDAAAVDKKIDNGIANTGTVLSQGAITDISGNPSNSAAGGTGCVISTNKALYNIASSASGPCSLTIYLSSTTSQRLYTGY